MIMALLFWIIVGLIAGALAKLVMPGDDPGGVFRPGRHFLPTGRRGGASGNGFITSIIAGIIGAVILLAIYRMVAPKLR